MSREQSAIKLAEGILGREFATLAEIESAAILLELTMIIHKLSSRDRDRAIKLLRELFTRTPLNISR